VQTLVERAELRIQQALLADSGVRELELLQEYLRTCRRTAGIVFALNNDVVMMNDYARQVLDPAEQSVLLSQAAETLAGRRPTATVNVQLPSGMRARLFCRPIRGEGRLAGGVVHIKLIGADPEPAEVAVPGRVLSTGLAGAGLVGSGALWLRGCHQVEAVHDSGEWLALEGEPGAGKLAADSLGMSRATIYRKIHEYGIVTPT
jgi:hypothetical protein